MIRFYVLTFYLGHDGVFSISEVALIFLQDELLVTGAGDDDTFVSQRRRPFVWRCCDWPVCVLEHRAKGQ